MAGVRRLCTEAAFGMAGGREGLTLEFRDHLVVREGNRWEDRFSGVIFV